MNYSGYRCADFVIDSAFRQWVLHPDPTSTRYWQDVLRRHPEQADTMAEAIEQIRQLAEATDALTPATDDAELTAIWREIRAQLTTEANRPSPFRSVWQQYGRTGLSAAAALLLALGIGWWVRRPADKPLATALVRPVESGMVDQSNTTPRPRLVSLPDGSSLLLQPHSQVRYARAFNGKHRRVDLVGEAYFEVVKDAGHPFVVYTNKLITKVLGTSFTVRAYANDEQATVTVRSGRVAVMKPTEVGEQLLDAPQLTGTVLTPNQQLVVSQKVASPGEPISLPPATAQRLFARLPPNFVFDATPVSAVFGQLEKTYGVQISYNKETLGTCRLTADLTDEPLSEKMTIICKSIEAAYTLTDNRITVMGPGCRP